MDRWWWLDGDVDSTNLTYNLEAGPGGNRGVG